MSDGMIGAAHITVPDLMDRVIAFRTLNYISPRLLGEPNEFKVDVGTGKIVRNEELIQEKVKEAEAKYGGKSHNKELLGALISPQYHSVVKSWQKEMIAECGKGAKHKAPAHNCGCGLYCYYELKDPEKKGYSYTGREVHCCVSVEGQIEAHSTGMRVEKMRVEAIFGLSYNGLKRLCEVLEIAFFPVESYKAKQFLNACREYGDPLPKNLRAGSTDELPF